MNLSSQNRNQGFLTTEAMIALSILMVAAIPFSYSLLTEAKTLRLAYQRSVAIQIVDGETERLAAGGWKQFPLGTHTLQTQARSATNLPPGQLTLTHEPKRITVEWKPNPGQHGRTVTRSFNLP